MRMIWESPLNFPQELGKWPGMEWRMNKLQMEPKLKLNIEALNSTARQAVGSWSTDGKLSLNPDYEHSPIRRFFRIGTVLVGG